MGNILKNKGTKATQQFKTIIPARRIHILLFVAFILLSFMFISPVRLRRYRTVYHSSQLTKHTERAGNSEKTEYRDSNGNLAIAADLGYAIMIVSNTENGRLEKYYDSFSRPIRGAGGYYGVLRKYDERGNNIRNIYLDAKNHPLMNSSGYAVQEREYNEYDQLISIRYYDTDNNPVCTAGYGHEMQYEYNANGEFKVTYNDISGNPVITSQGFASVIRQVYTTSGPEYGKTKMELYFNENGEPVSLSLGQYGVYKEYNESGRVAVLTYLDADGKPMVTNRGYTTIIYSYQANKYNGSEQYYDLDGAPFSLPEGQFGVRQENGQTVYLDQNGEEQFNLRNLLYSQSWIVIPLSVAVIAVSAAIRRKWNAILLILYIIAIVYMTLLYRESEGAKSTEVFGYYRKIFTSSNARADIIKNIWLFIPLGAILSQLYPKRIILLLPIVLSIAIEGIQFMTGTGFCELDDIVSNGIGGWIGFAAGKTAAEVKLYITEKKLYTVREGHVQ